MTMLARNTPPAAQYLQQKALKLKSLKQTLARFKKGKYILELGCGHGHFLTALAQKEQGSSLYYVGVDKNHSRIERSTLKSQRAGVNIFWINAEVEDVLKFWPQGREVAKIFILFPDPWPKDRHHKHRFVNAQTLAAMARIAQPQALLTFRSDHSGYCDEVRDLLQASTDWQLTQSQFPEGVPATVFETYHPNFGTVCAQRQI